MSMNFSEFKKLIGADPWNRDPETLSARKSSKEFETVAMDAEIFEKKLQSAVLIEPPSDLLDDIKRIGQQPDRRRSWMPLAMAASLLIAVGAVGMVWNQSRQLDGMKAYLADHYSQDGDKLIALASGSVLDSDVGKVMASLNAAAGPGLTGRVKFIKYCPTPEGRGAHMVVTTDQGPMTVIFMPKTHVANGQVLNFDQMHAVLVDFDYGSAAVIGKQSQAVENLETLVRKSLKTGLVGV